MNIEKEVVVIKSNDELKDFNPVTLEGSINKAIVSAGLSNVTDDVAKQVKYDVVDFLEKNRPIEERVSGFPPSITTAEIRKIVKESLISQGFEPVYEAYESHK